jgi:hypothetical protein
LETVKIEKSLKYSDFILNGYGCLWLFPSHHFPVQKEAKPFKESEEHKGEIDDFGF